LRLRSAATRQYRLLLAGHAGLEGVILEAKTWFDRLHGPGDERSVALNAAPCLAQARLRRRRMVMVSMGEKTMM
jgi:hypothetical protein